MKKLLGYKPYTSIGHLIESRLGEKDRHVDQKTNDFLTKNYNPNTPRVIYIEEKMDGSNVCVARFENQIVTVGRSGYDCSDSNQKQHRMFHAWVIENKEKFEKLLVNNDDRVCGEWMALAHGSIYNKSHFSQPFLIFDLFLGKNNRVSVEQRRSMVESVGLENAPLLGKFTESISVENALSLLSNPDAEGVVYKCEMPQKNSVYSKPWMIAKVVKSDKVDGKFLELEDEERIWHFIFDDAQRIKDIRN